MSTTITEVIEVPSPEVIKVLSPRRMLDGVPPDTRVIVAGVTWDFYERMVDAAREGEHCRISYDGNNIEMMTLGPRHERQRSFLDLFITHVARERNIKRRPLGSMTWRLKALNRGIKPDLCYYFDPVKIAQAAAVTNPDDESAYPMPDLAAEVDVSRPETDRPGIYVALQVPELWLVRNKKVAIEHLGADGKHVPGARSRFLPVTAEDITRWIFAEDTSDVEVWEERLIAWARTIAVGDVLP